MKKSLLTALILSLLASVGTAFAAGNPSAGHDVTIKIPELLSLRIVDGSSNAAVTDAAVDFDFITNSGVYIAKLAAGGGQLAPTNVTNFANVIVLSNKTSWEVNVKADSDLVPAVAADLSAAGIGIGDIAIGVGAATADSGVTRSPIANLSTTDQLVAKGSKTTGWTKIGLGGLDYLLNVQGDEAPDAYSATVTFTVSAP